MKLKTPPKYPERKIVPVFVNLGSFVGQTLQQLLNRFGPNVKLSEYVGYEYVAYGFWLQEVEDEDAFNKRIKNYEKKQLEYDNWFKENKEAIEEEIELRKKQALEKAERMAIREKQALEKRKKVLEKELQKLDNILNT